MERRYLIGLAVAALVSASVLGGSSDIGAQAQNARGTLVAPGLVLPRMNPRNGKELFISKGCVVCHSINGVGGTDGAPLDASTMDPVMNPFEFFAKMWRGAEPMIAMQREELGYQIDFTGEDLADIIAFVHNRNLQRTLSEDDIPEEIRELMEHGEESHGSMTEQDGMMDEPHE